MDGHFANIERDIARLDQKIERDISRLDQKITEFRSDVDLRFTEFRSYVDQRFTRIDGTLQLYRWMLGTILAFIIALFFKVFSL